MSVISEKLSIKTRGFTDIIDITNKVRDIVFKCKLDQAQVLVHVVGSTASITTVEYEPGLIKDLPEAFEKFAPMNKSYHHDETWHDGNGYAHVRASIIGNSKTFPVVNSELLIGTWQQIILIDFDNKPRTRTIIIQISY
ncbi:MAG: secondary thiamine-phosphate synthase enzyme YjbQ [bacterium]